MLSRFISKAFIAFLLLIEIAHGAAEGQLNWYSSLLRAFDGDQSLLPICSSVFALFLTVLLGLYFKSSVATSLENGDLIPHQKFNLRTGIEVILSFIYGIAEEQCGKYKEFFYPLLSTIFLFVLIGNLSGLIPGLPPFTENFSANLVLSLTVFIVYNAVGVYEQRGAYIKQFTGPVLFLAPLFLVLETVSHLARPFSLSFRLSANIYGDHLLLSIFSGLSPFLVPSFLMLFGLLVAGIQSFVFTMLTGVYVNMAISDDH